MNLLTWLEVEKSHDMPFASWRSRTPGIIQYEAKGLKIRGAASISPNIERPKSQELKV